MTLFAAREEHLWQRVTRGWTEDEDILICMTEIERLRSLLPEAEPEHPIPTNRECPVCGKGVVCPNCYAADAEAYEESRYEHGAG